MEEDAIYDGPVAAPEQQWHPGGNGYFRQEVYPYQSNFGGPGVGAIYIKNPEYLLRLFDAAAFRMNETGDIELLVNDPDGDTLAWIDITSLEIPEPTAH